MSSGIYSDIWLDSSTQQLGSGSGSGNRTKQSSTFDLDIFLDDIHFADLMDSRNEEDIAEAIQGINSLDLLRAFRVTKERWASFKLQNTTMINFLEKNDPKLLVGLNSRRSLGFLASSATTARSARYSRSIDRRSSIMSRRHLSGQRSMMGGSMVSAFSSSTFEKRRVATEYKINFRTKAEMAQKAAKEIEMRISDFEMRSMVEIRNINVTIEELKNKCIETEETARNFELHFLRDRQDVQFIQTALERDLMRKLWKFIEEWIKNGNALVSTLRLRVNSIKSNWSQQHEELLTKRDLKGNLGKADFQLLVIKRAGLAVVLEEKISNLAGLKDMAGRASLNMSDMKVSVMALATQCQQISNQIMRERKIIRKLIEEMVHVEAENRRLSKNLNLLDAMLQQYEAPSAADYIAKKQETQMFERERKILERKVRILQLIFKSTWKRCKAQRCIPIDIDTDNIVDVQALVEKYFSDLEYLTQ